MHWLWVLIVGAIIGAIAGAITHHSGAMGRISNIIAGLFHFQQARSFEVTDQADRQAPKVDFGA